MWGHLTSLVYSFPVDDAETLRNRIVAGFQTIRNVQAIWDCVRVEMRCRVEACIQARGGRMEPLL
jgi:hypothetical protein